MLKYRLCEGVVTAYAEQVNILTVYFGLACFNSRDLRRVFAVRGVFFFLTSVRCVPIFYFHRIIKI